MRRLLYLLELIVDVLVLSLIRFLFPDHDGELASKG
jgi:hypothetical protein